MPFSSVRSINFYLQLAIYLFNLHWLRVRERILFKLYLMVYKALSGLAPSYMTELCVLVASIQPRSSLRSAAHGTLFVPRTRLELGKRAFVVAALAGTVSLTTFGARQHSTSLNSAWKLICSYSHITYRLLSVELSRTTLPFVCKAPL